MIIVRGEDHTGAIHQWPIASDSSTESVKRGSVSRSSERRGPRRDAGATPTGGPGSGSERRAGKNKRPSPSPDNPVLLPLAGISWT